MSGGGGGGGGNQQMMGLLGGFNKTYANPLPPPNVSPVPQTPQAPQYSWQPPSSVTTGAGKQPFQIAVPQDQGAPGFTPTPVAGQMPQQNVLPWNRMGMNLGGLPSWLTGLFGGGLPTVDAGAAVDGAAAPASSPAGTSSMWGGRMSRAFNPSVRSVQAPVPPPPPAPAPVAAAAPAASVADPFAAGFGAKPASYDQEKKYFDAYGGKAGALNILRTNGASSFTPEFLRYELGAGEYQRALNDYYSGADQRSAYAASHSGQNGR